MSTPNSKPGAARAGNVFPIVAAILIAGGMIAASIVLGNASPDPLQVPQNTTTTLREVDSGQDSPASSGQSVWEALQELRLAEIAQEKAQLDAVGELEVPRARARSQDSSAKADTTTFLSVHNYPNPEVPAANPYPSVGYVGAGYDILQGFPFPADGSVDLGFRRPVKQLSYHTGSVSSSGRLVPDGVAVLEDKSSDFTMSHSMRSSEAEHSAMARAAASVGASADAYFAKASFAYSVEAKLSAAAASSSEAMSSVTTATVHVYRAMDMGMEIQPSLATRLGNLAANPSDASSIIEQYGTHYVSEVFMGGRMRQLVTMGSEEFESEFASEMAVSFSASAGGAYQGFGASASASASVATAMKMRSKAAGSEASISATFTGGAASLGSFDRESLDMSAAATWAASVPNDPAPMKYKLLPIADLLSPKHMPALPTTQIQASRAVFNKALLEYCGEACVEFDPDLGQSVLRYGDIVYIDPLNEAGEGLTPEICTPLAAVNGTFDICPGVPTFTLIVRVLGWQGQQPTEHGCPQHGTELPIPELDFAMLDTMTLIYNKTTPAPGHTIMLLKGQQKVVASINMTGYDGVTIVYSCTPSFRLLSPVPYRNIGRQPVHPGQPFFAATFFGFMKSNTGAGPSVGDSKLPSSKFSFLGTSMGAGVADGDIVSIQANEPHGGWTAIMGNSAPRLVGFSAKAGTVYLAPANIVALRGLLNYDLPNELRDIGDDLRDTAFRWKVRRATTTAQASLLGVTHPPIKVATTYDHNIGDRGWVSVTVNFNSEVATASNDPSRFVATPQGPRPALFASDFTVSVTSHPDGCITPTPAKTRASRVSFLLGGRLPTTYRMKAEFPPNSLHSATCLIVELTPDAQFSTGKALRASARTQTMPFARLSGNVTWDCSDGLVGTVYFHSPVVNTELAYPEPYDFTVTGGLAVSKTRVLHVGPTIGRVPTVTAIQVVVGAADSSNLCGSSPLALKHGLIVLQDRLQTPSQPGVYFASDSITTV